MARKNLLKGLMEKDDLYPVSGPTARPKKGAIGAVSRSIEDLKSRSVVEIETRLIDNAGLSDRLDSDPEGIDALVESIRTYGQQVPVLLRQSSETEGRYEIVFGRRRVQALMVLKQPVKAMVRDLTDHDLVVAQGQENNARKDLSFIEKAHFADQMRKAGYDRKVICDAISVDKTVVSRMLSIMDSLPDGLVLLIGAAPSAGRDRWVELAKRLKDSGEPRPNALVRGETSDARFLALFNALSPDAPTRPKPKAEPQVIAASDGAPLGTVRGSKSKLTVQLDRKDGFADWLADHLTEIHRDWKTSAADNQEQQ